MGVGCSVSCLRRGCLFVLRLAIATNWARLPFSRKALLLSNQFRVENWEQATLKGVRVGERNTLVTSRVREQRADFELAIPVPFFSLFASCLFVLCRGCQVALFMSLTALEQRFFKTAPTGMMTTLVFIATALLAPGFYLRVSTVRRRIGESCSLARSIIVGIAIYSKAILTWCIFFQLIYTPEKLGCRSHSQIRDRSQSMSDVPLGLPCSFSAFNTPPPPNNPVVTLTVTPPPPRIGTAAEGTFGDDVRCHRDMGYR